MSVFLLIMTIVAAPSEPVKVGVADFAPMIVVHERTSELSGSDYDMFEALVDDSEIGWKRGVDYEYVLVNNFETLIRKVESGEVDMAVAGISITQDRLYKMDFSQPYKNSGLRIMVPLQEDKTTVWSYISKFFQIEILFSLLALVVCLLFFGALLWLTERVFGKKGEPNVQTFEQGVLAAFDTATTIGYGRFFPVTRQGQIVVLVAFFCGAIVVGDVISTLTTEKIVQRLEGEINSPEDLKGHAVAVVDGTTSGAVVQGYIPSQLVKCDDFYKAAVQLRLGEVDAVVADDPIILNYLKQNPTHGSVAGAKFHPEDYGIAFARNAEEGLIKKFSIAIARLRESGKLGMIETQWYGE